MATVKWCHSLSVVQRWEYVIYSHNGSSHNWLKPKETGVKVGVSYHKLTESIYRHLICSILVGNTLHCDRLHAHASNFLTWLSKHQCNWRGLAAGAKCESAAANRSRCPQLKTVTWKRCHVRQF